MLFDAFFPFFLKGPEFLIFFIALSIAVLLRQYFVHRRGENAAIRYFPPVGLVAKDPYRIAYLRGGVGEAVRISIFSLWDRGLLAQEDKEAAYCPQAKLIAVEQASVSDLKHSLERETLKYFAIPKSPQKAIKDAVFVEACSQLRERLVEDGLLMSRAQEKDARVVMWETIIVLWTVSGLRLWQAFAHGRAKVEFLILLTLVATFIACRLRANVGSRRKKEYLESVETLFYDARQRMRRGELQPGGGTTDEITAIIAIFGLTMLPATLFPLVEMFSEPSHPGTSFSSFSSGDDSGGVSGGDSGGSDGGGSGCGGGCGGGGGGGGD
ncbi:putative TIGR04222 domain-containing membrane protein [Azospirillaceae bacterium]